MTQSTNNTSWRDKLPSMPAIFKKAEAAPAKKAEEKPVVELKTQKDFENFLSGTNLKTTHFAELRTSDKYKDSWNITIWFKSFFGELNVAYKADKANKALMDKNPVVLSATNLVAAFDKLSKRTDSNNRLLVNLSPKDSDKNAEVEARGGMRVASMANVLVQEAQTGYDTAIENFSKAIVTVANEQNVTSPEQLNMLCEAAKTVVVAQAKFAKMNEATIKKATPAIEDAVVTAVVDNAVKSFIGQDLKTLSFEALNKFVNGMNRTFGEDKGALTSKIVKGLQNANSRDVILQAIEGLEEQDFASTLETENKKLWAAHNAILGAVKKIEKTLVKDYKAHAQAKAKFNEANEKYVAQRDLVMAEYPKAKDLDEALENGLDLKKVLGMIDGKKDAKLKTSFEKAFNERKAAKTAMQKSLEPLNSNLANYVKHVGGSLPEFDGTERLDMRAILAKRSPADEKAWSKLALTSITILGGRNHKRTITLPRAESLIGVNPKPNKNAKKAEMEDKRDATVAFLNAILPKEVQAEKAKAKKGEVRFVDANEVVRPAHRPVARRQGVPAAADRR